MKNIRILAIVAALALLTCSSALAQGRPGGPRGQRPPNGQPPAEAPQHPRDPATAVQHLTAAFTTVAPFDLNKDGQLDDAEKEAVVQAIAEGKIQAPPHRTPPAGVTPDPERIVNRIGHMYAMVAPYDLEKNGSLDETEQAALKADLESGKLAPPGGPRGGRHPGAGGPRGHGQGR